MPGTVDFAFMSVAYFPISVNVLGIIWDAVQLLTNSLVLSVLAFQDALGRTVGITFRG